MYTEKQFRKRFINGHRKTTTTKTTKPKGLFLCFYNFRMISLISVNITIIHNTLGWKSGAVFLFYQNFLFVLKFAEWFFPAEVAGKICLIKQPCKIYILYLTWIYLSSLWGFSNLTYDLLFLLKILCYHWRLLYDPYTEHQSTRSNIF